MSISFKQAVQMYDQLRSNADEYRPTWERISKYVGIRVDSEHQYNKGRDSKSKRLDEYVDDPTAAISVNQFGEYVYGAFWGSGENSVSIIPSRNALQKVGAANLQPYYDFITEQMLYQANHRDAGFSGAFKSCLYDFTAFGTAGLAAFRNNDYGNTDNIATFSNYGVDTLCIDEGRGGQVDYIFVPLHWRIGRIVGEFATKNGVIDDGLVNQLPDKIAKKWRKGLLNEIETVVWGCIPQSDYAAGAKGKRGAKFIGLWWFEGISKDFQRVDYYAEKPAGVGRMVRVRGEVYGRCSGTMLLSSIGLVNYLMALVTEVAEKMSEPALGSYGNALFGDNAINFSSGEVTTFNGEFAGKSPIFPLYDLGDPSAIVQFLMPYLNEKITTGFKIDTLLDFNTGREQTATESMQRYSIRARSHFGTLNQVRTEMVDPVLRRLISMMDDSGLLGIDARLVPNLAKQAQQTGLASMIVPEALIELKKAGKPWYDLRFNNEIEDLSRTEKLEKLIRMLQSVQMIMAAKPEIVLAIDWYKTLEEISDVLAPNLGVLLSRDEYEGTIAKMEQAAQAQQQMAQAGMAASASKDAAQAEKLGREAQSA